MHRTIEVVDPQGEKALSLLSLAAIEARALYPELHSEGGPWPGNFPTLSGGTSVIAYECGVPVGCAALRPVDSTTVGVRRTYVPSCARRGASARELLAILESSVARTGYKVMRLETGDRQKPAMALYESFGFEKIAPFGEYANDLSSVCHEKPVVRSTGE